jgi:hypothetical protein
MRTRLTDQQVDELADQLERFAIRSKKITYGSYKLAHDPSRKLGILRAEELPREGLVTAASFGLAHEVWTHANFADRVELVQARDNPSTEYERIVVSVAEGSISARRLPKPGVIYQDAVVSARLPELAQRMPHATVLFPYSWEDELFAKVELSGGVRVWFLQVVPLYDVEVKYIDQKGFAAFEQVLGEQGAFFEKLNRPPCVVL